MAFNPELGSTSPAVLLDNAERLDKLVNGPELTEPDRAGVELDTWRGMMAKNDEIRQNLIPLSKQYATLAAAQADIVNIPEGSTTYYRSPDDSALAVEVINNAGTLQPTGRKMPSQQAVDDIEEQTQQATDWLQRIYLGQQIQAETQSQITKDNENAITALQHISLSLQVISEIIFSQESTLNVSQNNISNINTAIQVLSETLFSLGVSDSQTRNAIQSLSTSLQIVIDAINLAPSARDLDGARLQSLLNLSLWLQNSINLMDWTRTPQAVGVLPVQRKSRTVSMPFRRRHESCGLILHPLKACRHQRPMEHTRGDARSILMVCH